MPNYNHAPFLKQRIDSILNQSFQDFELILLDDCSSDNSREILSSYKENPHVSHFICNKTNSGSPFAQWNKGIELAQGEWVWIAESDDWADERFLETMLNEAEDFPSVGLLFVDAQYVYPSGETWQSEPTNQNCFYNGEEYIRKKLLYNNTIYNVSMTLFRKTLYYQINHDLYNNMRLCGDWFFYTLLCEHTDVLEIDRRLSFYRIHGTNTSSNAEHIGLSFIEGLQILEYIVLQHKLPQYEYAFVWGKQLVHYNTIYNYPESVLHQICQLIRSKFPLMYMSFLLNSIRQRKIVFKRKLKSFLLTPKQGEVWCLHRVLPERSAFKSNRELEITPDYLKQLIASKKKDGYSFVSLQTILSNSSRLRRKLINISFDDGFRDVYEYAFPIFREEQIPFALFLTTGMPNGTAHLWWLELEKRVNTPEEFESAMKGIYDSGLNMSDCFCQRYNTRPDQSVTQRESLSWEQLREMVNSGLCTIGSHTCSHPALTRVSKERIREELALSKQHIVEHLGIEPAYFSYPHSMESPNVQDLVKQAGYKAAFMGYGGSCKKGDNLYHLNRQHIIQP